jgi:hypothetical protein
MGDQPGFSAALPQAPRLVGRDRELATLRATLDAALAGQGSLVLIGGEAGIGKTALAEALLAEVAAQGAQILVGRCYDLSETPPYGPWAELFGALAGDRGISPLPAPLGDGPPAPDGAALFRRARLALASMTEHRPLALLLDDLHWADPASLDLLRSLARHAAALPLLLVATYRADELTRGHPLYTLLPVLVREAAARRVPLRPLDPAGVAALVRARYPLGAADAKRLVAYLERRAEGNPFFTGELLRALEDGDLLRPPGITGGTWALGDLARAGLPELVRQVIDGRAARLGEAARDLLAIAAILGQAVPLDRWAALAGVPEEALLPVSEAAGAARLAEATDDGTSIRFVHALVREALYAGIAPPRRRAWHRRTGELLATTLERGGHPSPEPDAVAYHFRQAGDARAVPWLGRSGARARALYAPQTAIDHLTRALDLARQLGQAPSPALHRERGLAFETTGDFDRAQGDQEAALALALAAADTRAEWRARLDLGKQGAVRDILAERGATRRRLRDSCVFSVSVGGIAVSIARRRLAQGTIRHRCARLALVRSIRVWILPRRFVAAVDRVTRPDPGNVDPDEPGLGEPPEMLGDRGGPIHRVGVREDVPALPREPRRNPRVAGLLARLTLDRRIPRPCGVPPCRLARGGDEIGDQERPARCEGVVEIGVERAFPRAVEVVDRETAADAAEFGR